MVKKKMLSPKLMNGSRLQRIKLDDPNLAAHPKYQRTVNKKWVQGISQADKFHEEVLEPVKISSRNGNLYIVDGQHTIEAMIALGYGEFDAMVWTGLTESDEARLFYLGNDSKKRLTGKQLLRAAAVAKDPDVVGMLKVIIGNGFTTSISVNGEIDPTQKEFDFDNSLKTCLRLYRQAHNKDGVKVFRRTIAGLKAWRIGGRLPHDAKTTEMINGIYQFVKNYCDGMTYKAVTDLFSMTEATKVIKKARVMAMKESTQNKAKKTNIRCGGQIAPAMVSLTLSKAHQKAA
mgnify:CR=1 FL=1|tara:strand:- start:120 stop:986 length:867 start_codon:yes stop_codon:yes gene_type:complete